MRFGTVILLLSMIATLAVAKQKPVVGAQKAVASAQKPQAAEPHAAPQKNDQELIAGLRSDIAKLQAMVQQMEMNLAQVDSMQSPLKHQFQLEIDTWKIMIRSMERRLDGK